MSWIKDVAHELGELYISRKSLRKFGLTVGAIFLIFGLFLIWRNHWQSVREVLAGIGTILFLGGLTMPERLITVYRIWMGFAFALGWVISRFILAMLFVFVLTPIGLLAKLFGKEFLDLKFRDGKSSYWIPKETYLSGSRVEAGRQGKKNDYEKMY